MVKTIYKSLKQKNMPFYIKKSVKPIEAKQLTEANRDKIMEWCSGLKGLDGGIRLKTPESNGETQVANTGDYIVKGYSEQQGWHFWPVKPDYFEENYQEITQ
jgi:hypothetical protein